ncbi:nuclease domain-containing protein [Psychrobacter pocilloporae]
MSKLRKSAQGQQCTLRLTGCNYNPETVVLVSC